MNAKLKKALKFLRFINYENLSKEVQSYGQTYSLRSYVTTLIVSIALIVVTGVLLNINIVGLILLLMFGILNIPILITIQIRFIYERTRFEDITEYMEQLIYSFSKNKKILTALFDIRSSMCPAIQECIDRATSSMYAAKSSSSLFEDGLFEIEKEYPCERLHVLHKFLIKAEKGGDCTPTLNALMTDLNGYRENMGLIQKEKEHLKRSVLLSISCTLVVISAIYLVFPQEGGRISDYPLYSASTTTVLGILLFIYIFASYKLAGSWLDSKPPDEVRMIKEYKAVVLNSYARKIKNSLISGTILGVVVSALGYFVMHDMNLVLMGGGFGLMIMLQPILKKRGAQKRTIREIQKAFPKWLYILALSLQYNILYNALCDSREFCPRILRKELDLLIKRINATPNSNIPFSRFFEGFELQDIKSAVRSLYALQSVGMNNAQLQITGLIERNNKMYARSDKYEAEDSLSVFKILILAPILLMSLQIFVDMSLFLKLFMAMFTNALQFH